MRVQVHVSREMGEGGKREVYVVMFISILTLFIYVGVCRHLGREL